MRARRLFVAGATGATGRVFVPLADARSIDVLPHARPATAARGGVDPRSAIFELSDRAALVEALRGCTTVVQLIGTIRARFGAGDTYETSDVQTTAQLVEAAREAGCDHVVLLSSLGAGRPVGAYLQAKAKAEALVRESGVPWTVLRPSAFEGDRHHLPAGARLLTRLPGLRRFRPILLEELASALLKVSADRAPLGAVLEDGSLWDVVDAAR